MSLEGIKSLGKSGFRGLVVIFLWLLILFFRFRYEVYRNNCLGYFGYFSVFIVFCNCCYNMIIRLGGIVFLVESFRRLNSFFFLLLFK